MANFPPGTESASQHEHVFAWDLCDEWHGTRIPTARGAQHPLDVTAFANQLLVAEFTITNQERLPVVLAVFVAYFLVAFVTSAASDFTAWWSAYNTMKLNCLDDLRKTAEDEDVPPRVTRHTPLSIEANIQTREAPLLDRQYNLRSRYIPTAVRTRAFFNFGIPLLIGFCTLGFLVFAVCTAPSGTPHR